jgi:hypothetical protein
MPCKGLGLEALYLFRFGCLLHKEERIADHQDAPCLRNLGGYPIDRKLTALSIP